MGSTPKVWWCRSMKRFGFLNGGPAASGGNALAALKVLLARRNSLTSRSSSLMRCASNVVNSGRWPLSISTCLTQSSSVLGTQPILGQSIPPLPTVTGNRLCAPAPCEQRVRGPQVRTALTCSRLRLLKGWSLLKTRGGSLRAFGDGKPGSGHENNWQKPPTYQK